ncbi:MAG: hypothetical protein ACU0CO_11975 [Shimia sp.]
MIQFAAITTVCVAALLFASIATKSERLALRNLGRAGLVGAAAGLIGLGWVFWAIWGLVGFLAALAAAWVAGLFRGVL